MTQVKPMKKSLRTYSTPSREYIDISTTPTSPNAGKVISLFSGAGGLDIGLEQAGYETAVCIEIDDDCRETLRKNRPEWKLIESKSVTTEEGEITRVAGDIRSVDASEILKVANLSKGEAALVVGGAPCQPFSNIGKKKGKDDERNGDLFQEFVRIVSGIQPKAIIFENVTGIRQSRHSDVIDYMESKLSSLGYSVSSSIVNSADFGVPQKRERFILLGIRDSQIPPLFPCPTHFENKDRWLDFKALSGYQGKFKRYKSVNDAFSGLDKSIRKRPDFAEMNISEIVKERMTYIKQGQNFKVVPDHLLPKCWKTGKHQGQDTFGRLVGDKPSVTIRTAAYNPSKGRYIHPSLDRGLNTMEMAALQGFPTDWVFQCVGREKVTLVSAGRQIGNAVPPELGRVLGLSLSKLIQGVSDY